MARKFIEKFSENGVRDTYDIHGYLCHEYHELRIKDKKGNGWASSENFSDLLYRLGEKIGVSSYSKKGIGEYHTCIPDVLVTIYSSDNELSRDECTEAVVEQMFGCIHSIGKNFGWSEWTIGGCDLETLEVGGHDILRELESHVGKYIHFIIKKGFSK